MKKVFLLLFILPVCCFGQKDYCKKITKNVDEKGITTYESPALTYMSVIKQFKTGPFFGLHLHFTDVNQHFDAVGALIELEDGTIIKDEGAKINCQQEMSDFTGGYSTGSSKAHSGEYLIQAFFHINEENIEKLETKKIVRIQLDNAAQKISDKDATRIMNYIKYMQGLGS